VVILILIWIGVCKQGIHPRYLHRCTARAGHDGDSLVELDVRIRTSEVDGGYLSPLWRRGRPSVDGRQRGWCALVCCAVLWDDRISKEMEMEMEMDRRVLVNSGTYVGRDGRWRWFVDL